jgi:hypothetical protein
MCATIGARASSEQKGSVSNAKQQQRISINQVELQAKSKYYPFYLQ